MNNQHSEVKTNAIDDLLADLNAGHIQEFLKISSNADMNC